MKRYDMPEGPATDLEAQRGRNAMRKSSYELADMLDRVTAENLHPEVDFGKPEGGEQR